MLNLHSRCHYLISLFSFKSFEDVTHAAVLTLQRLFCSPFYSDQYPGLKELFTTTCKTFCSRLTLLRSFWTRKVQKTCTNYFQCEKVMALVWTKSLKIMLNLLLIYWFYLIISQRWTQCDETLYIFAEIDLQYVLVSVVELLLLAIAVLESPVLSIQS